MVVGQAKAARVPKFKCLCSRGHLPSYLKNGYQRSGEIN